MKEDADYKTKILLSPEIRRIKNAIIKKFAQEPLDVMSKFVKEIVDTEKDTIKRLGAMAARVEILRMRISEISNKKVEKKEYLKSIPEDKTNSTDDGLINSEKDNNLLSDWVRLRIDENSEINGVRFPKGVVIDVSKEDADKLIHHKKASFVEEKVETTENVTSDPDGEKKLEEKVETTENVISEPDGEKKLEEKVETTENVITKKDDEKIAKENEENQKNVITKKDDKKISEEKGEATEGVILETEKKKASEEKIDLDNQEKEKKEKKKPTPEELLAGFKMDEKK